MNFRSRGSCAIGLQVGVRTFLDAGYTAAGVFGLVGWEKPCHEPVAVRCQLAINGKAAPYWWLACANPLHQQDAWEIEHLDANGNVTHKTKGMRALEASKSSEVPMLPPKKRKKREG